MKKNEKFYLERTREEVTYGDSIRGFTKEGDISVYTVITLTEKTVPELLKAGIIKAKPELTLDDVLKRISQRTGWEIKKLERVLNGVMELMPMAAFNILVRELAVILDEQYPDHINNCKKLYVISTLDGRIHEVCRAYIKNFRNFAAFRTIEDAKIACKILRPFLKDMFSGKK